MPAAIYKNSLLSGSAGKQAVKIVRQGGAAQNILMRQGIAEDVEKASAVSPPVWEAMPGGAAERRGFMHCTMHPLAEAFGKNKLCAEPPFRRKLHGLIFQISAAGVPHVF